MRNVSDVFDEDRFDLSGHAQGARQGTAVGGDDRRFAGGVDFGEDQGIDRVQDADKILEAVARARVAVRLESEQQAAAGESATRGGNGRFHFGRVVAVVVDQSEASTARQRDFAVALEAATDALELGQRLDDRLIWNADFGCHRNGRQRVEDVVQPRQIERDRQTRDAAVDTHAIKLHAPVFGHNVLGTHVGRRVEAVTDDLLRNLRHDLAHVGVVGAEDGNAVERQTLEEIDKRLFQPPEVVTIGLHVIGVDVGDDRDHRRQEEEGRVGLVSFGHQKVARTEARVGAGGIQTSADDEGRVHGAFGQNRRHEAGRRRLAVRAGDGDALLQTHQLGEHLRARHQRHFPFARRHDFGVVGLDCCGNHHRVGLADILGGVPGVDADALRRQAARRCTFRQIGTAHGESQVRQHFGDSAHADATDSDEVNVLYLVFHFAISSHTRATSAAASGRANARAFSAICSSCPRL